MRKGPPNVAGEKVDLDVLLMLLPTGYQIKTTEFSKPVCFPMYLKLLWTYLASKALTKNMVTSWHSSSSTAILQFQLLGVWNLPSLQRDWRKMLGTTKLTLKTSVAATRSWRECVISRALLWSLMVRILPPIWCHLKQKDKGRQETAARGRRTFSHRTRKNHHGLITKLIGIFHLLFSSMNLALFITDWNTSNLPTLLFRRITWLGSVIL